MSDPKRAGQWDWSGACDPQRCRASWAAFSVGCFQWLPKAGGVGVKRGRVVKRFSGKAADPESVYARARAWCADRNAQSENAP